VAVLGAARPDWHPRYFMPALPAFLLLVAAGADGLPRRWPAVAAAGLALSAAAPLWGLYTDPAVQKQDYRAVMASVESAAPAGGAVLLLDGPPFGMMERYRSEDSPVQVVNLQSASLRRLDEGALAPEIERRVDGVRDVWLAADGGATGAGLRWLAGRAYAVDQGSVQDVTLGRFWVPGQTTPGAGSPAEAVLAPEGLSLAVSLAATPAAGPVVPLCLRWTVRAPTDVQLKPYRVSLRLVDAAGNVVTSADRPPVLGTRPTTGWAPGQAVEDRQALLLPAGARLADLHLEILLYDVDTLQPIGRWRWRQLPFAQ
jgi:hypothetical protein